MIVLIVLESAKSAERLFQEPRFAVGQRALLGRNRARKMTVRGHGSFTGGTSSDMPPPPGEAVGSLPEPLPMGN